MDICLNFLLIYLPWNSLLYSESEGKESSSSSPIFSSSSSSSRLHRSSSCSCGSSPSCECSAYHHGVHLRSACPQCGNSSRLNLHCIRDEKPSFAYLLSVISSGIMLLIINYCLKEALSASPFVLKIVTS